MKSKIVNFVQASQNKLTLVLLEKFFERKIKESMKLCPMKPLTKGQESDIKSYFKKYFGREVPTYWHQYSYSRNGVYSEKYIPASIYNSRIIWSLNNFQFSIPYVDKGFYDTLFPDVNRPKTIIKNVNGFYYDDKISISKEEAIERCSNLKESIIKPSVLSCWGVGDKFGKKLFCRRDQ